MFEEIENEAFERRVTLEAVVLDRLRTKAPLVPPSTGPRKEMFWSVPKDVAADVDAEGGGHPLRIRDVIVSRLAARAR